MAGALKRIPSSEEIQSSLKSKGVDVRLNIAQKLHADVVNAWKESGRAEVVKSKPSAKADSKEYSSRVGTPTFQSPAAPVKRSTSFGR